MALMNVQCKQLLIIHNWLIQHIVNRDFPLLIGIHYTGLNKDLALATHAACMLLEATVPKLFLDQLMFMTMWLSYIQIHLSPKIRESYWSLAPSKSTTAILT